MRDDKSRWLEERNALTSHLEKCPYDPRQYLQRATCHEKLGYSDLATSDAYRALLLTDEVLDDEGEYHAEVVEVILAPEEKESCHTINKHDDEGINRTAGFLRSTKERIPEGDSKDEEPWQNKVAKGYALQSYKILARTLSACGDLKGAYDFTERGLKVFKGHGGLQMLQGEILERYRERHLQKESMRDDPDFDPREDLPGNGFARREIYPWNKHEPDRFLEKHITYINREMKKSAPKCKVHVTELPLLDGDASYDALKPTTIKQLGIFAMSDIDPHEPVLLEPSVLTSSTGLHDPFCDACSTRLPSLSPESPLPSCSACDDIYFCSQACLDRAQKLYHPAICGIMDFDILAKDPSRFAATSALYTLLIGRTMAMAETQGVHPLDLAQIKYLWGDYSNPDYSAERTLPFSFSNNIAQPLHLLARLDKDPFAPETLDRYDTWVINTLLAKFRGTANAKMNERTGMPEVAGVHWLWSLANHSCAPNVQWEWEKGKMGFVARGDADVVKWGESKDDNSRNGSWMGGIKAEHEVLNHYCDVRLPVKERREWAVGALGGLCVCQRCSWEEKENGGGEK